MLRDAKVIMVATNEAHNAIILFPSRGKHATYHKDQYFTQEYLRSIGAVSYFLYIICNDPIGMNDWCYDSKENRVIKNQLFPNNIPDTRMKIIASNNVLGRLGRLPSSFLEHYVTEFNKSNVITKVGVKYDYYPKVESETIPEVYSLKVDPNNRTITITVPESAVYTKEKVRELCLKAMQHGKEIQAYHQSGMEARYARISENQWLIDNL